MSQKSSSSSSSKPTVSYTLFMYRQELKRRDTRYLNLNKTKISLTNELISRSVRNIKCFSGSHLKAISRELLFKKKLKKQNQRIHQLEKLGIKNANPNAQSTEL